MITQPPPTATDTRLKYRLKALFILFYGTEAGIRAAKERLSNLPPEQRISLGTVDWDINIRLIQSEIVAEHRLVRYARFFGVTVDYIQADLLAHMNAAAKTKAA